MKSSTFCKFCLFWPRFSLKQREQGLVCFATLCSQLISNWKKSAKAGLVRKLSFPAWKRPKKTSIKKTEEKEKLWRKKPFENSCCNNSALLLAFALRKKVAQLYEEGKTLMIHLKEDVPHFPVYVRSFMLPINTKWSERVLNIQDRMLCFSIQLPTKVW